MSSQKCNYLFITLFSIPLLFADCQPASQPGPADEAAIRKLITETFKAAWDVNDEKALAATFTEDADLTFPTSDWIKGQEAIEKAFEWDLPEGRTIILNIRDLRFVDQNTALVNVDASFQGGDENMDPSTPDYWDSATSIMQKENGEWKYAALRVMPMRENWDQTEQAIANTWNQFSKHWEAGNMEQATSFYTKNASNIGSNTPERVGRENIKSLFEEMFSNQSVSNFKWKQDHLDIMGPVAYQYGTFEQTWTDKESGKSSQQKGRFICSLQLEADGVWRFHRFIFTDLPE